MSDFLWAAYWSGFVLFGLWGLFIGSRPWTAEYRFESLAGAVVAAIAWPVLVPLAVFLVLREERGK